MSSTCSLIPSNPNMTQSVATAWCGYLYVYVSSSIRLFFILSNFYTSKFFLAKYFRVKFTQENIFAYQSAIYNQTNKNTVYFAKTR